MKNWQLKIRNDLQIYGMVPEKWEESPNTLESKKKNLLINSLLPFS